MNTALGVKVWGDFACFTRPEMKAERVSYPVITPTAARGVLESIFWKPEFRWQVHEIWVLKPIAYFSIVRNEVKSRLSPQSVGQARSYFGDDDRTQRHTLALRDVAYVIRADVVVAEHARGDHPAKFRDQFRRRVEKGRAHSMPYLGCREFSAFFSDPAEADVPIAESVDLGQMLLDIAYGPNSSGGGTPQFFRARLDSGILNVPRPRATGDV